MIPYKIRISPVDVDFIVLIKINNQEPIIIEGENEINLCLKDNDRLLIRVRSPYYIPYEKTISIREPYDHTLDIIMIEDSISYAEDWFHKIKKFIGAR